MLQSIEIENFRCFRHSRFENFGRVNLIGGKNNAGKTALLEAILLGNIPTSISIAFLEKMRGENNFIFQELPELAWVNFFYRQNKNEIIRLKSIFGDKTSIDVDIICEENQKQSDSDINIQLQLDLEKSSEGTLEKINDSTIISEISDSNLTINSVSPKKAFSDSIKYEKFSQDIETADRILNLRFRNNVSVEARNYKPIRNTFFIPTGYKKPSRILSKDFEQAKLQNNSEAVLYAFQLIDDSIEKIDSINIGEARIYIYRKNEPPQVLNFFGDALNKIADLILRVVNNPNCILLIDEIENGIHHTNQKEFWRMLIKLAVTKDVQIFATSHSAEMIHAFQSAAIIEGQEDNVRYIEMLKSQRTDEIVGNHVDMKTLAYNFRSNNPYRGE